MYGKGLCEVCDAFLNYYPLERLQSLILPKVCGRCAEAMTPFADSSGIWWSLTERGLEADETRRQVMTVPPDSISVAIVSWGMMFRSLSDPMVFMRRDGNDKWHNVGAHNEDYWPDDATFCALLCDNTVGEIQFRNEYADDGWVTRNLDEALEVYASKSVIVLNLELYRMGTVGTMAEVAGRFISEPSGELVVHRRVLRRPEMEDVTYQAVPHGEKPYSGKLFVVTYCLWPAYALQYFLAQRPNTIFIEGKTGDLNRLVEPVNAVLTDSLQLLIHYGEVVKFRGDTSAFAKNKYVVRRLEQTPSDDISDLINHLIDPRRPSFDEVSKTNADTAQWPWTYKMHVVQLPYAPRF